MVVVLSDLHFSEAESSQINSQRFNRNLPPEKYRAYFQEVNKFALANNIVKVDFVLAGDVLELSRSGIWLEGNDRPYTDNDAIKPGSSIENTILKIINAIKEEINVAETLALFRNVQDYFTVPVEVHLILGNHDRLANATPAIRKLVREMFGIDEGEKIIPHHKIFEDKAGNPFCLVRHGHEYDPTNFGLNVHQMDCIPTEIPESIYGKACLGDITTVEFGVSLSWLFVKHYGKNSIQEDETLMALYKRLMEFDDVRPESAWLSFLFSTPGVDIKRTWALMKPCFTEIIQTLSRHKQFNKTLRESAALGKVPGFLLNLLLKSGIFDRGVPYWLVSLLMKTASKTIKLKSQVNFVKREELILDQNSGCKLVISGHTHFPEVTLISAEEDDQRYYINTGTWRNVIPATKDYDAFGRLKALTKVMVFYPLEKSDADEKRPWAFHHLSGVSYGNHRYL